MLPKDLPDHLTVLGFNDSGIEVSRKIRNAVSPSLGRIHFKDILFYGVREFQFFLNACHTGAQHHGKGEIGITGRIRGSKLDPGRQFLAWLIHGYPNHGRPVPPCP